MVLVAKKKQMFWYVCTWFEFIIGHMTSMFNLALWDQILCHYLKNINLEY